MKSYKILKIDSKEKEKYKSSDNNKYCCCGLFKNNTYVKKDFQFRWVKSDYGSFNKK